MVDWHYNKIEAVKMLSGHAECKIFVKIGLAAEKELSMFTLRKRQNRADMRKILRLIPVACSRDSFIPKVVGDADLTVII
jgi:hypothetical protein